MPTAQELLEAINQSPLGGKFSVEAITEDQLQQNNSPELNQLLREAGFLKRTPLWFYILKEAEIQNEGNRLGQLGSWLVGHTIVGLIRKSPQSILTSNWSPKDSRVAGLRNIEGIMDFLVYAKTALPK
jgi:hypothetical protein